VDAHFEQKTRAVEADAGIGSGESVEGLEEDYTQEEEIEGSYHDGDDGGAEEAEEADVRNAKVDVRNAEVDVRNEEVVEEGESVPESEIIEIGQEVKRRRAEYNSGVDFTQGRHYNSRYQSYLH
jgi:hypothetical protein